MTYVPLPQRLVDDLRAVLDAELAAAVVQAAAQPEPRVVRDLAQRLAVGFDGVPRVAATLGFVHQASYVEFSMPPARRCRCEAGDLLVVVTRIGPAIRASRAVLLQAKRYPGGLPGRVAAGDQQHFLYAHWPRVTYTFGREPSTTRVLGPDVRFQGSRYLMIPRGPGSSDGISVCVAKDAWVLGGPQPATEYLLNMVRAKSAVPYEPNGDREWDGFVDDLLLRARRPSRAAVGRGRVFGSLPLLADDELPPQGREEPGLTVLRVTVTDEAAGLG